MAQHRPVQSCPYPDSPAVPTLVSEGTPLDIAETSFRLLAAGPEPLAVDGRTLGGGLPRRRIPLGELASVLMHPSCGYQVRDRVWRLLVEHARSGDAAWTVGAVGVALPGLRVAAARLARAASVADVEADLLAGFLAALSTIDLKPARVCARLCNAAHIAARGPVRADEAESGGETNHGAPAVARAVPVGHPDLVLARAVRLGVITTEEADAIGATRLEETSLAEYAGRIGITRWAAYRRRTQAEARLAAALRTGRMRDSDDQTIAEATLTTAVDPEYRRL
ncbi:MAG: hypothetical protein HKP61_20260 [Dactylosporangium sp.]|nr:hypothetical protein [Dactylosporangium sp.]NNJ63218.1 hypothetical protein [Dactylosporangium sp.]